MDRSTVSRETLAEGSGPRSGITTARSEGADFRIQRAADLMWEVSALSDRAARWVRANYQPVSPSDGDVIRTDLVGANRFMGKARTQGFRIEYIGPHGVNLF
ncbi:hypothetical protein [Sinorhizobium saheli]|uniref:Uncharacterized protein n=1 Tax=Sinorhizobium saheli TaxID=36856 RepID=A0A178Y9X4_SINSA|nr:hypothetical protein [Sinorhizobium saheli]MQW90099.1 hypothetical protein [Sinorhizobium saheli]OAP43903.1 hypothetical protein ATB98_08465 [Sinorhizobium saheli]